MKNTDSETILETMPAGGPLKLNARASRPVSPLIACYSLVCMMLVTAELEGIQNSFFLQPMSVVMLNLNIPSGIQQRLEKIL